MCIWLLDDVQVSKRAGKVQYNRQRIRSTATGVATIMHTNVLRRK